MEAFDSYLVDYFLYNNLVDTLKDPRISIKNVFKYNYKGFLSSKILDIGVEWYRNKEWREIICISQPTKI